jgi:TPR repeat protein
VLLPSRVVHETIGNVRRAARWLYQQQESGMRLTRCTALCGLLLSLQLPAIGQARIGAGAAAAAPVLDSSLRISCEDEASGAEVYLNGKFRGECPVDLRVGAGSLDLRVLKPVGGEQERVFEQTIRMGPDSAKRIDVVLSAPRLTAAAQRARQALKDAEAARLARQADERRRAIEDKLARMRKAAEGGDGSAMLALSDFYSGTSGATADLAQAQDWLRKAASAGDPAAMGRLGERYENGEQVPKDAVQALDWYRKAAEAGDPVGQAGLGAAYYNGNGIARDVAQARTWFEQAAAAGNGRGTSGIGTMHYFGQGGYARDLVQAATLWEKAMEQGSMRPIGLLARLYGQQEEGAPYKPDRALALAKQGAALGNADAMAVLGFYYYKGVIVPRNLDLVLHWSRKAAELGNGRAMANMGAFYSTGTGVPTDKAIAASWFKRAAEVGSPQGMLALGAMYRDGEGVPVDRELAMAWLRKARDAGDASADTALRQMEAGR